MLMERFADAKSALEQGSRIGSDDAQLQEALAVLHRDWPGGVAVGGCAPIHTADREASAKRCALLPGIAGIPGSMLYMEDPLRSELLCCQSAA